MTRMDWTGGTRRRYTSTSKTNSALQRQKAHFARVRAKAPHPPTSTTDFFREAATPTQYQPTIAPEPQPLTLQRHSAYSACSPPSATQIGRWPLQRRSAQADTTSSRHSSSKGCERTPFQKTRHDTKPTRFETTVPGVNTLAEEETPLLAQRESLLARPDWLGLAAARPAQFALFDHRDDDKIGKRRKLTTGGPLRARHGTHRRVPSPFEHRFRALEAGVSDGPQSHDVNVKVGSMAFSSEIQPPLPSVHRPSTSMRPPSTQSDPLSEESMLLGPDEEGMFERGTEPYASLQRDFPGSPEIEHGAIHQHCPVLHRLDTSQGRAHGLQETPDAWFDTVDDITFDQADQASGASAEKTRRHTLSIGDEETLHSIVERRHSKSPSATGHEEIYCSTTPELSRSDDERKWRRMMHFQRSPSSQASRVALRSSSLHYTHSTVSAWPPQRRPHLDALNCDAQFTPNHATIRHREDMLTAIGDISKPHEEHDNRRGFSNTRPSMPESDEHLAAKEDDGVWRRFVLGNQSSSSEATIRRSDAQYRGATDRLSAAPSLSSSSHSADQQQPGSDQATIGDTLFAARSSVHPVEAFSKNHTEMYTEVTLPYDRDNTSMIGHAATSYDERESHK